MSRIFVGSATRDYYVQVAYGTLKKRGYSHPIGSCYYKLLGILDRDGLDALEWYVKNVPVS